MESYFNIVVIEGGVVRIPELKYTSGGLAMTNFPIAVQSVSFKEGNPEKEVSYFDVYAWGNLAEICSTYLKKGTQLMVSGKLKQSRWESSDGKKHSKVQIMAKEVKFLPQKKKKYS